MLKMFFSQVNVLFVEKINEIFLGSNNRCRYYLCFKCLANINFPIFFVNKHDWILAPDPAHLFTELSNKSGRAHFAAYKQIRLATNIHLWAREEKIDFRESITWLSRQSQYCHMNHKTFWDVVLFFNHSRLNLELKFTYRRVFKKNSLTKKLIPLN